MAFFVIRETRFFFLLCVCWCVGCVCCLKIRGDFFFEGGHSSRLCKENTVLKGRQYESEGEGGERSFALF